MSNQAIVTKFIYSSATRGARIKASCNEGSAIEPYDDGLSATENHARVARLLAGRYEWRGAWISAMLPGAAGSLVWCNTGASFAAGAKFMI